MGRARSKRLLVRPDHHRERPGLGPVGPPAHRGVGKGHSALCHACGDPARARRVSRCTIDQQRAGTEAGEEPVGTVEQCLDLVRGGETGHDDIGRRRGLAGCRRMGGSVRRGELARPSSGPVPHGERTPACKVHGHRSPDGPKTEKGDPIAQLADGQESDVERCTADE